MKRILTYLFIGLMAMAGGWPVEASQRQTLADLLNRYHNARFHPQRVLVKYRGEARARLIWLQRGEDVFGKLAALGYDDRVEYAEPDLIYTIDRAPNDERTSELWGMQAIRALEAWDMTTGSEQVVVAITDTGVDYNHPDLVNNMWRNLSEVPGNGRDDDFNGFVDDYYGWNAITNGGDPMDNNDHGTHVAGTIGAVGDNNTGVVGVNWRVKLMALKFLGSDGSGTLSDAIEVIDYAVTMKQRGVNIVAMNASWGSSGFSQGLKDAVDRATAAGILFVAAAGNEGTSQMQYPAGYNNALAVAAVEPDGQTLTNFSSYGNWVDVAAPGRSILSTVRNNRYASFSGTSMATPHVAGLAGLMSSVAVLSVNELRQSIRNNVRFVPGLQGKVQTSGVIDAYATLQSLGAMPPPPPPPPPAPGQNQPPTVTLIVNAPAFGAGTAAAITAQASDPDNDPLTFQWQATAGELRGQGSAVMLDTSNITSPDGSPVDVTVQVLVSDGRGGQAFDQVTFPVTPRQTVPAKFTLQITPDTFALRGRALLLIQINYAESYSGGMKLEPVVMNNEDEVFAIVAVGRNWRGKPPTTAMLYVALLTNRPTASQYRIQVKGTDDFGGETLSNIVTATVQ